MTAPAPDLRPVVETILAFDARGFPAVTPQQIVARIDALFHLQDSATFRGALWQFSLPVSFQAGDGITEAAEHHLSPYVSVGDLFRADRAAYASSGVAPVGLFEQYSPRDRETYFGLWLHSALSLRRRFAFSLRVVTFEAFYSMPEAWSAIGYAGPYDARFRRS